MIETTTSSKTFLGNNSATEFPVTEFGILEDSYVSVYVIESDGTETLLVLDTDFSVTYDEETWNFTINYPLVGSPLATGDSLRVDRTTPRTQGTNLSNTGFFNAENVERALDKVTMLVQEVETKADKALEVEVNTQEIINEASAIKDAAAASALLADASKTAAASSALAAAASKTSAEASAAQALAAASGLITSVKTHGALGDGSNDDTSAIQAAFNSGATGIYFPPGRYKITASISIPSTCYAIRGSGRLSSVIETASNIPCFVFDTTSAAYYYRDVANIGFAWTGGSATRTGTSAILVSGSGHYFAYSRFSDIAIFGLHTAILNTKSDGSVSGSENMFNWNLFTGIMTVNSGAYSVEYAFRSTHGSGTGNVYSNSNIVTNTSAFLIGDGTTNVGDIIITGIHFGGAGAAITLVGGTHYGGMVAITACQFDAGLTYALVFTNITGYDCTGCNFGGGVTNSFTGNCGDFYITGRGGAGTPANGGHSFKHINAIGYKTNPSQSDTADCVELFKMDTTVAAGSTVNQFQIDLPTAYSGAWVEYISHGLQTGVGYRYRRTTYWISRQGTTTPDVVTIDTSSPDSVITHGVYVGVNGVVLRAATTASSGDGTIASYVRLVGNRANIKRV